ncbi:MAG: ankyrin repeat domain-containing protein [Sulfuricurvum sp.]|uniref:ankyrin repeat domain-containing protein n=1 Tax=Sulfuricurvum sp. TaxID=2025608 RepID=UPI00260FE9BE|nr:ankyrin repeat domain-containing protein [Sulfuricurvum sp.]MDD2368137.1 ankyrin repeat domain-containing protein [Sulfuricurvum sp.]MDD2950267.1 ankyrin repeat domain-containing protein [Sulfuricurvum sp.]MDD5117836.1 ankyrin repeat domain-containing protein [Sulfuricurvum sp.]
MGKENSIIDIQDKLIYILTSIVGLIALSLLLWEILPISLDYDFFFKRYVNQFYLKYFVIALPYIGLLISLLMVFKKKKVLWLFLFSIFSIIYPFRMPFIQYINQNFHLNIAEKPQDDSTPLFRAVEMNQTNEVVSLLEHGANPNETFTYHPEVIYSAIRNNNVEMVKQLLKYGAKINRYDPLSATPLHLAVIQNNIEIVKLLLDNHATVNAKTIYDNSGKGPAFETYKDAGKTPLHLAVQSNNFEIVKLLLENGANLNITDNDNINAFGYAKTEEMKTTLKQFIH